MMANQRFSEVMPLIMDLAGEGIFPYVNGNKIVLTPSTRVTEALRHLVRDNKRHLMSGLIELERLAGSDWFAFEVYPEQLRSFVEMVAIEDMRQRGVIPDHYTATTDCKHCGPVPTWPGCAPKVGSCVWCFNRIKGLPMPNAVTRPHVKIEHR